MIIQGAVLECGSFGEGCVGAGVWVALIGGAKDYTFAA
jgi:hypothetical protein